jgi:quercetin dioxygenase-like cupin family protein
MVTRRQTLLAAFALLCQQAAAQDPQRSPHAPHSSPIDPVFQHDLPNITMDDWQVTVSEVDFPPGRMGRVHHHAGFVLAYVLEGAIVSKVSGQEQKTYHKGEMFFEPPGSTHEVSNNASQTEPARLLAMIFAKKGATLTLPGPA